MNGRRKRRRRYWRHLNDEKRRRSYATGASRPAVEEAMAYVMRGFSAAATAFVKGRR